MSFGSTVFYGLIRECAGGYGVILQGLEPLMSSHKSVGQ